MTAYVALLFAVNVGGRKVPSTRLRALATRLGLAAPRTLVNSGNLVVAPGTSGATSRADVARLVHDGVVDEFDVDATVVVLTTADLARIVADVPFPTSAREDPAHLLVLVGERPVDAAGVAALDLSNAGRERLAVAHDVLYATFPDGIGRSRLTTTALSRAAGTPVTGRNWNTVTRLLELARETEESAGAGTATP
ncbi:DUF1697 domain-containing protein [Cellulosimicrobium arenosum]|uniref:DUF1697 domain-containing protein n=1 Tax=Cellulosimicrobium arenosum TaxID=2708133 RepID=A0A927IZD4_9MICO|nr:DUF1697 domain-containing protein [Cellulosimicrobium arenosum]MBD8078157.1 DUF1697 domain-containing protein [Cellulosimicrobium arenosum]